MFAQAQGTIEKPLLRGSSHQHAIFAALAAGVLLVASARGLEAKLCCGLYVACLTMLFTASTLYHRYGAATREKQWSLLPVVCDFCIEPYAVV